jgi:hypothetical protein
MLEHDHLLRLTRRRRAMPYAAVVDDDRRGRDRPAASGPAASDYTEKAPEIAAYVLSALAIIGLGVALGNVVLNWIVGPGLAIVFVLVFTPLCRRVDTRLRARRGNP